MGRIAAALFTSLDGSAERPDLWHGAYYDDAMGEAVDRHTERCEAYLMGRILYERWSQHWPTEKNDDFADFINPVPKYVLSTTLAEATWENTSILRSLDEVRQLRDRTHGTIGMSGSLSTIRSLLQAKLLDELILLVDPLIIDGERRWTDDLGHTPLHLASCDALPTGALHLVYRST
jgi:dihydrofolate reductase